MTTNLFDKTIVFTDIHFGLKNNSDSHNTDCINFIKWMIEQAKSKNIKTCIFMGDYTHHRNSVNTLTLDYMMTGMELLNDYFDNTYFLVGNHDMYLRDNRKITSTKASKLYKNITFIDSILHVGNCTFLPWLIKEEWKTVQDMKGKYLFGHLEIPGFKMNAMVDAPDHGTINNKHFSGFEYVFSGHFHKRQNQGSIHYIGNPFGHNYADVWDFDRGAMVLEWGKKPEYLNWEDGPRYINIPLTKLMSDPTSYLNSNTHAQVIIDVKLNYEDASYLKEVLCNDFNVRDFKLITKVEEAAVEDIAVDTDIQTVDEIVIEQLSAIDSSAYDPATLIAIYNDL